MNMTFSVCAARKFPYGEKSDLATMKPDLLEIGLLF